MSMKEEELVAQIVDAIELNTEKLQELLERVECIDNSLDDIKDTNVESFFDDVLGWFKKLHQQGGRI